MNEAFAETLVGGAIALGVGGYAAKKLYDLNRDIRTAQQKYTARTGKPPTENVTRNLTKGVIRAGIQAQNRRVNDLIGPEIVSNRTPSGRFGRVVVQPRGTLRQNVKDRVDSLLKNQPLLHRAVTGIGRSFVNRIQQKFTKP